MSIRIYVEGGGDHKTTHTACRQAFAQFFAKLIPSRARPRVISSGSRKASFDNFCAALNTHQGQLILLLVDSEDPVPPGTGPWVHLYTRDGWDRPNGTTDDQAHLMVQCMEAWFLADKELLADYYKHGFLVNSLPAQTNVELVAKRDVLQALEHASMETQKGRYHKTKHGFDLLARIDPSKVKRASTHAARLCETVLRHAIPSGGLSNPSPDS